MSHTTSDPARSALMRDRNFLWLMGGGVISLLGDQFTMIALPWLVLKMTGDTLMLGMVLAVMSIPRALFMLIGGALVDRYSPKEVLMLTKYANTVLLGLLGISVLTGHASLWMIFVLAFGIGLSAAFTWPAATAIMPDVVPAAQLRAANSIMLSVRQVSMFAGPLLAGILIAVFGDGGNGAVADARGLAVAFLFDAFTFAFSAWTLSRVAVNRANVPPAGEPQSVLRSVAEGLRHFWNDQSFRACCLYWTAVSLCIGGPVQVAMPVLADSLPGTSHGAAAFGTIMAAHGIGTLIGMVTSGAKPGLRLGTLGTTMLAIDGVIGILFIPVGQITAAWQGAALLLTIGMLAGFLQVTVYTWILQRVPPALVGRAMSLFMFIFAGLAPISAAATGALLRVVTPAQLFACSGSLLVAVALVAALTPHMRAVSDMKAAR